MKTLHSLTVAALACSLALGSAAEAKWTPVRSNHVWDDIQDLERDVNRADERDTISEREAAGIRAQIADIKATYHRWNANGLTPNEANTLENRIKAQRNRLGNERNDADSHRG